MKAIIEATKAFLSIIWGGDEDDLPTDQDAKQYLISMLVLAFFMALGAFFLYR